MIILLVVPWLVYVSVKNEALILFTTASGVNLYLGCGIVGEGEGDRVPKLTDRWAVFRNLRDEPIQHDVERATLKMSPAQKNAYFTHVALQRSNEMFLETSIYGLWVLPCVISGIWS